MFNPTRTCVSKSLKGYSNNNDDYLLWDKYT